MGVVTNGFDAARTSRWVCASGSSRNWPWSGTVLSDGKMIAAKQKVNGGPSVLYDAIAVIPSAEGAALLAREATAKDFVSDAFAHAKFIAYCDAAKPLFSEAGVKEIDGGFVALKGAADAQSFLKACGKLRFWEREAKVHAEV
jgi:catalase